MKLVQHAMKDGRQYQAGSKDEHQPRIQRVESGKGLPGIRSWCIHRPHAAEQHGAVQEGIDPRQIFIVMVTNHAEQEGTQQKRDGTRNVQRETQDKAGTR